MSSTAELATESKSLFPGFAFRSLVVDLVNATLLVLALARSGTPIFVRWLFRFRVPPAEVGIKLRKFLEERGLVYRKLGQYLALRQDLLPTEICAELDLLFEEIEPMPFAEVQQIVETELGAPLAQLFQTFEATPIGSASVAQVHRAVTVDGERLAVKVQRGGIREEFASEVRNFRRIAHILDFFDLTGSLSLEALFDEFARFTFRELDFRLEAQTADRLRQHIGSYGHVPKIRWDLSTARVLAMEYIDGVTLLHVARLSETGNDEEIERLLPGVDLHETVANLSHEFFSQLFVTGFFHGDPHPANIILRSDGSFVLIDCGIFGELAPQERRLLAKYTEAVSAGKAEEAARYYAKFCSPTYETDQLAWQHDLIQVLGAWHAVLKDPNLPLAIRHMAVWQGEIAKVLRHHHVRTGANQLLVWRALMILDSTALRMPGSFDVHGAMVRFFRRNRPRVLLQLFDLLTFNAGFERLQTANEIPGQLLATLHALREPINEIQIRKERRSDGGRRRRARRVDRYFPATLSVTFAVAASQLAGTEPGFMIAASLSVVFLLVTVFGGR